jgi:hypothetical protein
VESQKHRPSSKVTMLFSTVCFELAHDQSPEEKEFFDSMESHFKPQINLINAKLQLSQKYVRSSVESTLNGESEKRCRVDFDAGSFCTGSKIVVEVAAGAGQTSGFTLHCVSRAPVYI